MISTIHLPPTTQRWLRDSPLTPYVMVYFDHLIQCRYAENHVYVCRSRIGDVRKDTGQTSGSRYKTFRYHAQVL